ncbi:hypothetical protein M405DRAFT_147678 [Rhizopogon salebrosus TDB-379]|nr:hypothetical protein M405DRAFT_147678 [Rhizopogon salebrosus TDB-379]
MCRPCMRESIFTSGFITSFIEVCFSMGIPGTSDVWALSSRFNLAPVIIRTETNVVAEL